MIDNLKIAIVCDWLTVYAGAERVIYEMHKLFPNAPIYTTLYSAKRCPLFKDADVRESGLRFIPGARRVHRLFFPFMPGVFERMDLSEYDIVISSSHAAAKGVITMPGTLHISYCHSPTRYLWDQSHSYQKGFKLFSFLRIFTRPLLHRIRLWDRVAADRVDKFVSNSDYIGRRIEKYYGRKSDTIYPPVDLERFSLGGLASSRDEGDEGRSGREYYLAVGRLIPYKRFDLMVEAFNKLKKPLKIVGTGPEMAQLKRRANKNIEFVGSVTDEELRRIYQGAKALIFPQLEDFGIVPLESMACGAPVIAYGRGGALETVKPGISGVLFDKQDVASLVAAVRDFEKQDWDAQEVAASVEDFGAARFKSELRHYVQEAWKEFEEVII